MIVKKQNTFIKKNQNYKNLLYIKNTKNVAKKSYVGTN